MSVDNMAKIAAAVLVAAGFALRPLPVPAQTDIEIQPLTESDTRLYLNDGTVVMGRLIEHSKDLVIVQVKEQVFTFELEEIDRIVTLDSLGAGARTVSVIEFPYISFLGGTVAFGLLSWLQFDTASDRERDADLNAASGVFERARELRDKAERARLLGWSSAVLAAGSTVVALVPRREKRRIFPELTLQPPASGSPGFLLAYNRRF
jgi:hypothetical protein